MARPQTVRPAPATTGNRPRIDRLGGTIDLPNNSTSVTTQTSLGAGNAATCATCGEPLKPKRASRRQRYCCYGCRDEARRARNFAVSGGTRYPSQAIPRSARNNPAGSMACEGNFRDLTQHIIAPLRVVAAEVIGRRNWRPVVSLDGVRVMVTRLGEASLLTRRRVNPEQIIHRAVSQHLRPRGVPGLVWWHTPNGGRRNRIEGAILNGLGVRPGVTDLILLHHGRAFALELKTDAAGRRRRR